MQELVDMSADFGVAVNNVGAGGARAECCTLNLLTDSFADMHPAYNADGQYTAVAVSDRRKTPQLQPEPHTIDDERHVRSWTFRYETASHIFLLRSSQTGRVTVRLSMTRSMLSHSRPVYILDIEAWKMHAGDM
ncbi:hypothetical protein NUW54_g11031 [Trametes sanguinea]|uniref:Uncharacterized protein n=1 Tax=Trametes sanguinea TaxID=158606 RepID=A0ACC1NMV6_9APHY|nr:hypothetical protein NUW54_g11031 [Trametes sanguinea]